MNNIDKQNYYNELDCLINALIKSHNRDENYTVMSAEIKILVDSIINTMKLDYKLTYKEKQKLYEDLYKRTVDILLHAGFEYKDIM